MAKDRAIGGIPGSPVQEIKRGNNYLFAIGINGYQHFPRLTNARKDIEDITKVLVDQYSFEQAHVQVILDEQASRENIVDQLNALREIIQPQDRLLIYYSGHGYSDNERGYWIPVDAEHDHISSFVSNADILDIIKLIRARHILLISDSCFSGSLLHRDVASGISKKAIEAWDKDPSRYAFISGKGVVSDGNAGENSPFASGIIRHLQDNEADAINIVRLADQVTQEISFNYEQLAEISPLYGAGHKGGQYIFFKKGKENLVYKPNESDQESLPTPEDAPKNADVEKQRNGKNSKISHDGNIVVDIDHGNVTVNSKRDNIQPSSITNQTADKIYNIDKIDNADFS